jgi:energy-coupling factor transporter ATP-binding protein EcfA2
MQEDKICPYPGLRPFNEEESIFFRGREEHIEKIILQLEEKKFLMLTGASGDGKSSIVYAGIIPNARAGFFKAKFNSWLIADFRPERSPLKNMAKTLAEKLGYTDVAYVEKELSFGFSSLINLYKKSPYYLDATKQEYVDATEAEQKKLKRKAANLFILVDQFEEFFTNLENYNNGKPSVESQLVVNLLIETAKIALTQDLPIYIVCTMRSDYIGQCATFRGLPEYIGYSQFFIPRLKRKEIHQVIEEPATLSGNRISNRLIETLINDCDGQDQLPILQHALNRIWKSHAEQNSEEMDLIHYAKVGGMDGKFLPDDERAEFQNWYKNQTIFKQKLLDGASLSNVLNAHARELFENAVHYCNKHVGRTISREEAHNTLKKIFTCLTKINDSRAVRNRATVLEVKQIIGENVDNSLIEGLVNLFREPSNTLLKPFITDASNSSSSSHFHGLALLDTDILDITHESLIRNWTDLTTWTKEDNENVSILDDFKKQVGRWEKQARSKDYLLTIGTLTYFKTWYKNITPNPYLLAKYDLSNNDPQQKLEEASAFIRPAKAFLRLSQGNIKRNRRLIVLASIVIAGVLIGFSSWALIERNSALQKTEEAKRASEEAVLSEQLAVSAGTKATMEKQNAERNEKQALSAKQQAEKSKRDALLEKTRAEASALDAKQNAALAKSETEKATQALSESERAKREALELKEIAEKAQKEASQIGLLSLAQSVALKSDLFRSDPQLQALMAYQAYQFNIDNGGDTQDPLIYKAIRSSYLSLNADAAVSKMISSIEQRTALLLSDNNTLVSADKGGSVYKWDLKQEKQLEKGELKFPVQSELLKPQTPIEYITFTVWPNILISGHKNGKICIWDITTVSKPILVKQFDAHTAPIRAIVSNSVSQFFATAAKDSNIFIWNFSAAKTEHIKQIKTSAPVHDLLFLADGQTLVAALENGELITIDINSLKTKIVFPASSIKPWCIKLNEEKNILAVGFSDGKVRLLDVSKTVSKENVIFTFSQNNTAVEKMAFDTKNNLLAIASADKSIKIINLSKKGQKPQEITDIKSKTRYLLFDSENKLCLFGSDHAIRRVEVSTEKLAVLFCEKLKRNLTAEEWNQNISEVIPYQKTCKNK